MESSQNVQHKPSQLTETSPDLANDTSSPKGNSHVLIQLLAWYPWLLLSGLLLIPVAISIFAVYNLSQVGDVVKEEPEQIPPVVIEEPIKTSSETTNPTPLWMVAAIILSCGSGCLIILRSLKITKHQKPHQNINNLQVSPGKSYHQKPNSSLVKQTAIFVPPAYETKHTVTILPPEEIHPLDNSKESLADLLDIRKQSSLSSILGKQRRR
jgi:hypothetical protein